MASLKILLKGSQKAAGSILQDSLEVQKRALWGWLNSVFNRIDEDRRKEFGPDRTCAEWMLRCGGSVKWKGFAHWEKNYNSLPSTSSIDKYKVEEIDGTKSCIMSMGFPHLDGLKHVKKIILHDCRYLNDEALLYLPLVKDSLIHLQLSSCGDITEQGLPNLRQLTNLQQLVLYDLPEIKNKRSLLETLKQSLPKCHIDYKDVDKS